MSEKFTTEEHAAAEAEGWWLSERDDGFYEIQRFDEDPQRRFYSDWEAHHHVTQRANEGSRLHVRALALNGKKISC
jgi:hypothetical protein